MHSELAEHVDAMVPALGSHALPAAVYFSRHVSHACVAIVPGVEQ